MDPRVRRELARYGAPAAFLAAVTIAVLLVKSGLNSGDGGTTTSTVPRRPVATTTAPPTTTRLVLTTTTPTSTTVAAYYDVQAGDTLGSIAARYGTSVDELLSLNPGIDPATLRVGQRIRVG
jgi:LysM repeat protein